MRPFSMRGRILVARGTARLPLSVVVLAWFCPKGELSALPPVAREAKEGQDPCHQYKDIRVG